MIDPLFLFVFAGLFSPGPNVILLTASGARFGIRRTVPHIAGVVLGVGIIAALTGLGIGTLLARTPSIELVLKSLAAIWILYMAYAYWTAARARRGSGDGRPWTVAEAFVFQAVNPKIWAVALAAASGFPSDLPPIPEALRLGATFSLINLAVCTFWTAVGDGLTVLLSDDRAWRIFMRGMALLLAASALMVFL